MIVEQENVEELEEDKHILGHVEIDVGDIFVLTYNLLPTHPLCLRGWVGFVFGKFVFVIPLLILVLELLPHLPFPCEKVGEDFLLV
jgi:hypothetical protein